jgi:hypothetical protein
MYACIPPLKKGPLFFWHSADFVYACYSHADAIWRELNPLWFLWDPSDSLLTSIRNLWIPLCWAWVAIFRSLMVSIKNEIWPDHWVHHFCNISFPLLVKHVQCLSLDTLWSTRTRTHMTCVPGDRELYCWPCRAITNDSDLNFFSAMWGRELEPYSYLHSISPERKVKGTGMDKDYVWSSHNHCFWKITDLEPKHSNVLSQRSL